MPSPLPLRLAALLVLLFGLGATLDAQTSRPTSRPGGERGGPPPGVRWRLELGGGAISDTDFDDIAGSVESETVRLSLSAANVTDEGNFWSVRGDYSTTDYDFDEFPFFTGEPFDRIQFFTLSTTRIQRIDEDYSVFLLGSLTSAREEGAEFEDSVKPMILGVVRQRFSETLSAGLGIGLLYDLDDEVRAFPAIAVDWRFDPEWQFVVRDGVRLTYLPDYAKGWELSGIFAFSAQFGGTRFRMADDGPVPDGTAEFEGFSIGVEAAYRPNPGMSFTVGVSALPASQLRIDDRTNDAVLREDLETGVQFSISGQIGF